MMNFARLQRKDSFLGIHFDFHARPDTHPVGTAPRPDIFAKMLDAVQPDFMQCDTKGHPGYSSYPTRVGTQSPGMKVDILRMLRELTAQRNIALYGHHSGLYDIKACADHPEWAIVRADGSVSPDHLSPFGPYCDELLIPQLKELALEYGLDGAWVDGECWAMEVDYSEHARKAWKAKTHRNDCPMVGDGDYESYREFCRQGFRDYVRHYIAELGKVCPEFQITSNWIFSGMMPEAPTVPVAYLSGDYSASNSYNSARFHGRCLMHQNLPWDLMAWGQNAPGTWLTDDRSTKEAPQYCQEAAVVLAQGGGFQFFNHQYDGGCLVQEWAIPIWKETAEFCRARQKYCFQAQSVPQNAVLYSIGASEASGGNIFGSGSPVVSRAEGLTYLCADSQLPTDILLSHHAVSGALKDYGMVMVPDCDMLEEDVREAMKSYVIEGGSVLLCGPGVLGAFADICPIEISEIHENKLIYVSHNGRMAAYQGRAAEFLSTDGWDIMEYWHEGNYFEAKAHPMLLKRSIGKGTVCALNFDLGHMYLRNKTTLIRTFFADIADVLFPDRLVRVRGSMYADITLMQKENRIYLNIINSAGPHEVSSVRSYSEIPPIGPLEIEMRVSRKPEGIRLLPEGVDIDYQWEDDIAKIGNPKDSGPLTRSGSDHLLKFTVARVCIHSVREIRSYFSHGWNATDSRSVM